MKTIVGLLFVVIGVSTHGATRYKNRMELRIHHGAMTSTYAIADGTLSFANSAGYKMKRKISKKSVRFLTESVRKLKQDRQIASTCSRQSVSFYHWDAKGKAVGSAACLSDTSESRETMVSLSQALNILLASKR